MKIIIVFCFIFSTSIVSAQTIFDIQVDKIYLDGSDILFVNQGEIQTYECSIKPIKLRDYHFELRLACEEEDFNGYDTTLVKFESIKKFRTPEKLINWIKSKKFIKNSQSSTHSSYLQYFDNDLMAQLIYKNYEEESQPIWQFHKATFWDYVFFRVNNDFLIIGLIYEEEGDIGGFIIPTKDGAIVESSGYSWKTTEGKIDSIPLATQLTPSSFYRIKPIQNDNYQLFDKLFQEVIQQDTFEEIKFLEHYIYCKKGKEISIYDKSAKKMLIEKAEAVYNLSTTIQFVKNGKVQCLDENGILQDTFPIPQFVVCGNYNSTERLIEQKNGQYLLNTLISGVWSDKREIDTLKYSRTTSTIRYLNEKTKHHYNDYSKLGAVFSFPYNYYLIETPEKQQLASLNQQKSNTEFEILFEGTLEVFGYNHPIKFQEGNLYGYYPQNKSAKYKKLEKFDFFFAGFELPNGKKGWLDINGNEYLKK